MPIDLPKPISDYYDADRKDPAAVATCFTEDAVVTDEEETHTGRKAILGWKTAASAKFTYTVEPFSVRHEDGKSVVTAHVAGNFPGSPVDLQYFFGIRGDKIASMEIKI
ncbi:MAG: nuclear transport factor 2 family protein [Rhodospirillales bacterium]|nr:nuclear transport factor 2 family protein [Rhodospirillales bacterium]